MTRLIIMMLIVCVLVSSTGFGMTVPSSPSQSYMDEGVVQTGGRHMSDDELVLMVVGIVCGTILVLAILN